VVLLALLVLALLHLFALLLLSILQRSDLLLVLLADPVAFPLVCGAPFLVLVAGLRL
jgi:hypothetical protein